jgi:sarcosine oxidase gamma subunit
MDSLPSGNFAIEVDGLSVGEEPGFRIASLRYFDPAGSFAATVRESIGRSLPEPLRATRVGDSTQGEPVIFLWRSPTETAFLSRDGARFAELERRLAGVEDGCMVDQTGGVCVVRVRGVRARDLLLRLGAMTAIPDLGEARSGRLAELHVLMACLQAGEFLLLVERVYANHLREWIGATTADF